MNLAELTPDALADNFALLGDWEARYAYVLDLGKQLPPFPESGKTEANTVHGCVSRVWLVPAAAPPDCVDFLADSDSHIVRGLIAILKIVYGGKARADVAAFDMEAFFARLGLSEHLSPNRRNGFFALVSRIRDLP